LANAFAHAFLVFIDGCRVDMPVTGVQCGLYGRRCLVVWRLPYAETDLWNMSAIVQSNVRLICHGMEVSGSKVVGRITRKWMLLSVLQRHMLVFI
jgi:hypothetical protein